MVLFFFHLGTLDLLSTLLMVMARNMMAQGYILSFQVHPVCTIAFMCIPPSVPLLPLSQRSACASRLFLFANGTPGQQHVLVISP